MGEAVKDPYAEVLKLGQEQMERVDWVCDRVIEWGRICRWNQKKASYYTDMILGQQGVIRKMYLEYADESPAKFAEIILKSNSQRTFYAIAYIPIFFDNKPRQLKQLRKLVKILGIVDPGDTRRITNERIWTGIDENTIQMQDSSDYCRVVITKYKKGDESHQKAFYLVDIFPVESGAETAYVYAVGKSVLKTAKKQVMSDVGSTVGS